MTVGETRTNAQDSPQITGLTSGVKEGTTSTAKTPRTYTEETHQKELSDALAKQGREHKVILDAVTSERDTLKTQIAEKQTAIDGIKAERETLQNQIEALTKDDPEKLALTKRDNELRGKERKFADDLKTLEAEKQTHTQVLTEAEAIVREANIIDISLDYENPDASRLSELCSQLQVKSKEQIQKIADTLWTKKAGREPVPAGGKTPGMKIFSGMTEGGAQDFSKLSADEKLKEGFRALKEKKK